MAKAAGFSLHVGVDIVSALDFNNVPAATAPTIYRVNRCACVRHGACHGHRRKLLRSTADIGLAQVRCGPERCGILGARTLFRPNLKGAPREPGRGGQNRPQPLLNNDAWDAIHGESIRVRFLDEIPLMKTLLLLLALLAANLVGSIAASAQDASEGAVPLRVGVVQNAMPCSEMSDGKAEGSAVELWQSIAQKRDWPYVYQPISTSEAAVRAAANNEIDLVVSCINIISERVQEVDFSVPYQEDSLAFLSRKKSDGIGSLLRRISQEQILRDCVVMLFAITMIATTALWLLSHGFDHKDILSRSSGQTFFKGWMMLAMGTGIYKMGPNPPSMIIITLANICRLVITSVFVGTTASLVFQNSIPDDVSQKDSLLPALQKRVGVDSGTISELWLTQQARRLKQKNLDQKIYPISGGEALLEALQNNRVGSIMADSNRIQVLSRLIRNPGEYEISAKTYNLTPQSFVFGIELSREKRSQINQSISRMRFNGDIAPIIKRWVPY